MKASLALALTLAGCVGLQLVADYDEQIVTTLTDVQRRIETFLVAAERETPEYERSTGFYDDLRVDLSALAVRAGAHDRNELSTQQIGLLIENVGLMEQIHKGGGLNAAGIPPLRSAFNVGCTAILKLELAKQRSPN